MCDPCSVKEPALGSSVGASSKQTTLLVLVLIFWMKRNFGCNSTETQLACDANHEMRFRLRNVIAVACCAHASSSASWRWTRFYMSALSSSTIKKAAIYHQSICSLLRQYRLLGTCGCELAIHTVSSSSGIVSTYLLFTESSFSAKLIYALDSPRSRTPWNVYDTCSSVVLPVYWARIGIPRSRNMYVNLVLVLQLRVVTCLLSSVSLVSVP
jgi:hypothetical protein